MDAQALLFTLGIEIGLALGYGLCFARQWIGEVRAMVLHMVNSVR